MTTTTLELSTATTTLLIVVGILLSIFIIVCTVVAVVMAKLVNTTRRVVGKAEEVIDSVENAAEVIKNTQGPSVILKLLGNILDLSNKNKRK